MDKDIIIRELLLFKKASRILDYLNEKYDKDKLKRRPDICKEIIKNFKDEFII